MAITMALMQPIRKVEILMLSRALTVNLITFNDAVMLLYHLLYTLVLSSDGVIRGIWIVTAESKRAQYWSVDLSYICILLIFHEYIHAGTIGWTWVNVFVYYSVYMCIFFMLKSSLT